MRFSATPIRAFYLISCILAGLLSETAVAQPPVDQWNLGLQKISINDPVIQHKFDAALWYPTRDNPTPVSLGPLELLASLNGTPAAELKGLIALSHGFSGSMLGHNDTAQHLARQGYLVVTPTHPDRAGLMSGQPELDPLAIRPRHLKLSIDAAIGDNRFNIADGNIGVVGYSLGTYTTLVALGAEVKLNQLSSYCDQQAQDKQLCSTQAQHRFRALAPHLTSQSDNRIKAAVLLAPAYGPLFSASSLSMINLPLQLHIAENDQVLEHRFHGEYFKKHLPGSTTFQTIPNAGHFTFMAPCPPPLAQKLPALCNDAEGVDRIAIHQRLNRQIAEFFDQQLK